MFALKTLEKASTWQLIKTTQASFEVFMSSLRVFDLFLLTLWRPVPSGLKRHAQLDKTNKELLTLI